MDTTERRDATLAFLFTDIEGSTQLWERHPAEMRIALARHDTALREAIMRCNGHVFKTIGDAFCAAFSTAADAVSAAIHAQLALASEPWPTPTPLKVRMALHSGPVEARDNDYFGVPLNRVARLLSAAHGGQILLSQNIYFLANAAMTSPVSFRDLGAHQLKDLATQQPIYQVLHPGLPSQFPPIRSLSTHPNNLPQQVTQFIGREQETQAVRELLQQTRLLTLTGAGGTGKTRLGLQVAADQLEKFPDGIWLIELATLSNDSQVPLAVASTVGVKEQADQPISQTLTEYLKDKQLLLLLDNCEHVIGACAKLAESLVRQSASVHILASSREALGIVGEQTYRVPSLSLPNPRQGHTPESLASYESVQLFLDRARLTRSDFQITPQNAAAVASLCCRLDGIPLAIELSAARLRSLSVEEINAKLNQRFRLLTGGARTAVPRQQTLRALIDWSYDLLNEQEKALLHRLSLFVGGWTLEASEQIGVGNEVEDWEVLDLLTSLVDKNLVVADQDRQHMRYRLLETVKEYAMEKLQALDEEARLTSRRHAEYFLTFAQERLKLLRQVGEAEALQELEQNSANLHAALEAAQVFSDFALWGELALVNGMLLQRHGYLQDAVTAIESGLQAVGSADTVFPTLRARLLLERAGLYADAREPEQARQLAQQAMVVFSDLKDTLGQARAENLLGQAEMQEQDSPQARTHYLAALANFKAVGDQVGIAIVQNNLGVLERRDARAAEAEQHFSEALRLRQVLRDRRGLAETLNNLGVLAFERQEWEQAAHYYREAIPHYEALRHTLGLGFMLANIGEVAESQKDFRRAIRLYLASILLLEQVRSPIAQEIESWLTRAAIEGSVSDSDVAALRREASTLTPEVQRNWALGE